MSYSPTKRVMHAPQIAANLLTFIKANNADAISWAISQLGLTLTLPELKDVSDSIANRANPVFPSIAFSDDNSAARTDNDTNKNAYSVMFEVMVVSPDANQAVINARVYEMAIIQMINDIPKSDLLNKTNAAPAAITLEGWDVGFDKIKRHGTQEVYMQKFQVKAIYSAVISNYL